MDAEPSSVFIVDGHRHSPGDGRVQDVLKSGKEQTFILTPYFCVQTHISVSP